jgi:hypothetical protein
MIDGTPWVEATEMLSRGRSVEVGGMLEAERSSATTGSSVVDPEWKGGGCFGAGAARGSSSEWRRMSLSLAALPRRRKNGMVIVLCDRHNPSGRRVGGRDTPVSELWELGNKVSSSRRRGKDGTGRRPGLGGLGPLGRRLKNE